MAANSVSAAKLTRSLGHDVTMVVPSGTHLSATAFLTRDVPDSAGEIRDDLTVRDQAAHQLIDTLVRDNIEPVLRDAIRSDSNAIPGINLAELLGVSP